MVFVPLRWGNIPLDDAVQFNHLEVVKLLQDYQDSYTPSEIQAEAGAEALSKENLESMVWAWSTHGSCPRKSTS